MRNLLLAIAAALTLASCGEAVRGIDHDRKIIDIANGAEPLTLDPQKSTGQWESNIIGNMFIGLTTEDAKGNTIPGMATNWETSADGKTWTFFLRDAQWSDGVPVTAYDFEYAYQRILNPDTNSEYASLLYPILNAEKVNKKQLPPREVGVKALDEKTLEIRLEFPAPYLPQMLTHQTSYPVPKHVVERWGDEWVKPQHIQVNGAYTLVKWWSNYIIHLRKNPRFHDARNVCLNELYFYPITDGDAALRSFRNGEYAWSTRFPGAKYDMLMKEIPDETRAAPYLLTQYFSINMRKKPFNDARVRQALSMALDRDFLTKNIWKSGYQPGYQFVPPGMPNYQAARIEWADMSLSARRARARQLLQDAGFGPNNPLRFSFSYRSGGENPKIAVSVQGDWHEIAPWVRVELRPAETQIHYANLRAQNFDIGDGGWVGDYADPQNYLYLLQSNAGSQNYPGYHNATYDALMEQANHEQDGAARALLMKQAEQTMLNDVPIIPVAIGTSQNLVSPHITGYEDNIQDVHRARWMCLKK